MFDSRFSKLRQTGAKGRGGKKSTGGKADRPFGFSAAYPGDKNKWLDKYKFDKLLTKPDQFEWIERRTYSKFKDMNIAKYNQDSTCIDFIQ
eukprot:CAMPEP_0116879798 /NCGR_PEP_ID=MMETSP0463-20121206/11638_1 /TAXON_ID=181622 /ORGANISM="Strombidinopsis sp, Strain SopsisLIS2011" /LENGTH=90 /DNA_ID=CAMNT_0004529559 /DNA_START=649 /DNA_END=921 /DNA_ORIENTATION=+